MSRSPLAAWRAGVFYVDPPGEAAVLGCGPVDHLDVIRISQPRFHQINADKLNKHSLNKLGY